MHKKLTSSFLITIICIVPLIITPSQLDYYYHPKIYVIYLLCFTFASLYFIFLMNKDYPYSSIDKYVVIYLVLIMLSTLFSVDIDQSLKGRLLREEGAFALCCYLFVFQLSSKFYNFSTRHVNLFLFSALLIALYAISQYFGFDPVPIDTFRGSWENYAYSTIGNPNFLGSYLTIVLPISIFYYVYSRKFSYLLLSSIFFLCLLCSRTRSAWVGFLISFILLVYLIYKNKINFKYMLPIITAFSLIFLSLNLVYNNETQKRASTIVTDAKLVLTKSPERDRAGSTRYYIWRNALKLIPERPLLGYGPDTFDIAFMGKFKDDTQKYFGDLIVDKAHNEYIQIAVTTGLPSLIFYLLIPLTILYRAIKGINKNILIIPLLCSISGYLIQGFFNISVVSVAPVYYIVLGILNSFTE